MQLIQGIYEEGKITLKSPVSVRKTNVWVLFPIESDGGREISRAEAFAKLKAYKRKVDFDIDYDKEKEEYLDEKYGNID